MIKKRPKSYWSTLLYRRNFKIVRLCDENRLLMMILWIKDEKMNKNVNKLNSLLHSVEIPAIWFQTFLAKLSWK